MADKEKKVAEAESKKTAPAKQKKEKKPGRVRAAWKGFRSELKKIVWPSRKQVFKNTLVVLTVVVSFAIVVCALDYAFNYGIQSLTDFLAQI